MSLETLPDPGSNSVDAGSIQGVENNYSNERYRSLDANGTFMQSPNLTQPYDLGDYHLQKSRAIK
jgi:hypothetical protein